jgi:allophanate hydrolase
VAAIIGVAAGIPAHRLVADGERLDALRVQARALFATADALLLPTAPAQPTIAAVAADPIGENAKLGVYTNFANLLDLCAVAVPAGEADGGQFGVSVFAPAFADRVAAGVARLIAGEEESAAAAATAAGAGVDIVVVGAHMRGGPLEAELTGRGGRLLRAVRTAPEYRLHRLATDPPKPALVRVADGGATVMGELWRLPPAGLAGVLATLPAPMALGRVRLDDGAEPIGFLCEPSALDGAPDLTAYGGWRAYLDAEARAVAAGA